MTKPVTRLSKSVLSIISFALGKTTIPSFTILLFKAHILQLTIFVVPALTITAALRSPTSIVIFSSKTYKHIHNIAAIN